MATKKKSLAKPKRTAKKKVKAAKLAPKRSNPKKATKKAAALRKKVVGKKTQTRKKSVRKNTPPRTIRINPGKSESRFQDQSGDLQGVRDTETADSESVRELLEEGNALEAGIVAGVEAAEDEPEREVYSRQVPEDDVPPEYLDQD